MSEDHSRGRDGSHAGREREDTGWDGDEPGGRS